MARQNRAKAHLKAGNPSVGTWLRLDGTLAAEMMAHVGFDWLVLDAEHSAFDIHSLQTMLQTISTTDTVPMVRVPWNDPIELKRTLDAGAYGVVIPMVKSAADAEKAVRAVRYPPVGDRSFGSVRGPLYAGPDYQIAANDEILLVLQLEHVDAVRNVREILSVPGFDAVFIGPNDLSASMMVEPGVRPPREQVEAACDTILQASRAAGVPCGYHCGSADEVNRRVEQGYQFLALAMDTTFLVNTARAEWHKVRLPS
jgi:4-hydroxy-2-oxoheptanedioate aldolase